MGVDGYACGYAIGVVEDDVGGFSCDSRQLSEILHRSGNLPMKLFYYELAAGFEVSCFVMIEASGADVRFQLFYVCVCVVLGDTVFFEKGLGDYVDSYVGCLCREHGGDEEFEWVGPV